MQTLYKFTGTVETVTELNSIAEVSVGDVYKCKEDLNNYVWNGSEWINCGVDADFSTIIETIGVLGQKQEEMEMNFENKLKIVKDDLNTEIANLAEWSVPTTVTNENGTAIKFYDGTMICTKKCMFENVTTTANGAIFISPQQAIGDFALPFIDIPTMTLSKIGNNGGWVFNHTQLTKSSAGYVFFATTTAQSSKTFGCHLIAIGRWK